MKKILYLISFMLLVSCAKNNASLNEKLTIDDTFSVKEHSTSSLVKEKFLEFYDLKLLLENKPNFRESIEKRLIDFKLDSSSILSINSNSKIKNIKVTELSTVKENSNLLLKVFFDIEEEKTLRKDSILAYVVKGRLILDEKEMNTTKIKFSRFNDFEK